MKNQFPFFIFLSILSFLSGNIEKKTSLESLSFLLNQYPKFFLSWNETENDFSKFLEILTPWMTSVTDKTIITKRNPHLNELNCLNPRYSTFLTGDKLPQPRVIIDFIPFGYDLDKLEIRLYENYEVIDAFIIFESPITQTGINKPLLFNLVRKTNRFSQFSSKIIYLTATKDEMIETANFLNSKSKDSTEFFESSSKNNNNFQWSKENWGLERAMRVLMIKKFQEITSEHEQYELQQYLLASLSLNPSINISKNIQNYLNSIAHEYFSNSFETFHPPLAIQNDGDEMISSKFLLHLKHCELAQSSIFPIQPLTYHFKYNLHTLQRERKWEYQTCPQDLSILTLDHAEDLVSLDPSPDRESFSPNNYIASNMIYNYLFIIGPKIDLLYNFLEHQSTLRQHYSDGAYFYNTLCLGSGIHMSSIEEPGEVCLSFLFICFQFLWISIFSHPFPPLLFTT